MTTSGASGGSSRHVRHAFPYTWAWRTRIVLPTAMRCWRRRCLRWMSTGSTAATTGRPGGGYGTTSWMRVLPSSLPVPESPVAPARRLSPLIRGSLWLHGGTALALLVRPQLWPWGVGALLADHLVLTAAGLWPRSALLGSNWTRLPPA